MKKLLVTLLAILFFCPSSYAQSKFEIGVTTGLNLTSNYSSGGIFDFSNIFNNQPYHEDQDRSMRYGLLARYNLSTKWSLIVELNTEARGFKRDWFYYRYRYISFPLIWQFHFGSKKNIFIDLGTHLAIKSGAGQYYQSTDAEELSGFGIYNVYGDIGRFDWGLIFGLGYQHHITGNFSGFIAARLNASKSSAEARPFGSFKHYAYAGVIGIAYGFGKSK
jgi:hypothetical protein